VRNAEWRYALLDPLPQAQVRVESSIGAAGGRTKAAKSAPDACSALADIALQQGNSRDFV
jgi:hypothetical protein